MKRFFTLFIVSFFLIQFNSSAQTAGFNTSYAVFSFNGGVDQYYCMFSNTTCGGNPGLDGAYLGSFTAGTSALILKGAEHNVWKCGVTDITATNLNYRIYQTGDIPGSFIPVSIGYLLGNPNGCGGQDQQWKDITKNINVLAGLVPGNYTIEIYSDLSSTEGTKYVSNLGANYKATFVVTAPLPVKLLSFSALQKGTGIAVKWNVADEINFASYDVEKSTAGINFSKATSVAAAAKNEYSWIDAQPVNGANFYRLKMTDKNGTISYSSILKVIISQAGRSVTIFPNPVVGNTFTLQLINVEQGSYQMVISNVYGQIVMKQSVNHTGGSSSQTFNISNLSKGNYIIKIAGETIRMVN